MFKPMALAKEARTLRPLLLLVVLSLSPGASCLPRVALAAPSSELEKARAIFDAALRDEDAGLWVEAREKLRQVFTLRRTVGVRYHLALCDEQLGDFVGAMTGYSEAAKFPGDGEREARALALKRFHKVESRVAWVRLDVWGGGGAPVIRVDGVLLGQSRVRHPLNPGAHEIEVSEVGFSTLREKISLREGESRDLRLALSPAPQWASPQANAKEPPTRSPWPWVTSTGALVLAVGGVVSFVVAGQVRDQALLDCPKQLGSCDAKRTEVRALDTVALSAWIASGALAGLSIALFVRGGSSTPSAGLYFTPGGAGWQGRF